MLNHPILDQLLTLKLIGMHRALTEQMHMDNLEPLSFEERLGLLVDRKRWSRKFGQSDKWNRCLKWG